MELTISAFGSRWSPRDRIAVVGFGESMDGSGIHLLVQRPVDHRGRPTGAEYFVTRDNAATFPGGIHSIERQGRSLRLTLTEEVADAFELPTELVLVLPAEADAEAAFAAALWMVRPKGVPVPLPFARSDAES